MRKHTFEIGEYYHVYNRGVEKRNIFLDDYDLQRFLQSLQDFNTTEPIGSIYELSFQKPKLGTRSTKLNKPLISIVAYCINPNHFHLLITPLKNKGVEKFMQKLAGYTRYFNEKNKRTGVLFQGKFKSKYIDDNNYLLRISSYINMNNRDELGTPTTKLSKSSLEEYTDDEKGICDTKIVLGQFKNLAEYKKFALESWQDTLTRKEDLDFT